MGSGRYGSQHLCAFEFTRNKIDDCECLNGSKVDEFARQIQNINLSMVRLGQSPCQLALADVEGEGRQAVQVRRDLRIEKRFSLKF